MSRTHNAGIVTAYGAAVRGGYTGTYEEFCTQQAQYAENARQMEQAVSDVRQIKTSVESAVSEAEGYANNAIQSATNASNSATQASESASNANQSANNASSSADSAGQSATSAQTSATNASASEQSARQSAETAQDILDSVQAEGNTQIGRVQAKGNEILNSLPSDFTQVQNDIAALNGSLGDVKADLEDYNSYNIFDSYGMYNGGTAQGATLTWDNTTHVGTITRVAAASGNTVFGAILGSNSGIPTPLVKGETYILQSDISNDNVKLQMVEYRGSAMTPIFVNGLIKYTIPNDIDGIMWRLYVKKGFVGTATIRVKMLNAPTNKMIGDNTVSAPSGAKLLSFGNDILTGSVWKNGAFDHLANYDNSPYGNIASALNISEKNVVHTMISSAGLMYDSGEGSFLDNILDTDITGYDYILTHLYYRDLTSAVSSGIGSLDSTAGDGTIAGVILSLLAYIRTNNPNCRLILVGVPPAGQNNSDIAENVFTVGYSNGSNIMECDYLMHQLAEQEHFDFLDWEALDLSYHWKDFTDNLNMHLNNEDTYRVVGEYLGNQITAQKNEGDSNRVVTRCCKIKWTPNTYINGFGFESASDNHKVSDFIPVVPGETIRMQNVALTTTGLIYLTCYDITKSKIADARKESGTAGSIVSEVEEYIVPSTGAYIRVTTALTQVYCHVWHKDKTYIPHPRIEAVTGMIIGENNACAVQIPHFYIEGTIVNPNNVAVNAGNWANTGIVPLNDTYDYIKLLNVSAGQSCFALFFDNDQNVISADLADSNGVFAAERVVKPPVGATYIRCNMLKANKDIFKIYGLKTNLVVGNAVPETANQTFHAMTGNKLHTIFRKTKAIGSLFTISDDDTTSLSNVQKFHTVCMAEGIRGCYAVMTKNTEADSNIVDALREYEKDGFQCVVHCHHQRPIYKPSPDRNIVACREDMAIALQNMQKYGFSDFRHWISPYGVRDQEMKDFARDFGFDCLITVPTDTYCHFIPQNVYGLYSIPRMELYPTDAESLSGNTLAEIKAQMLDCATNGGWFHVCTHMYQWGDDLSRVTEILQYAKTLGMKNVTISGGLSYWRDIYRLYDLF